MTSFFSVVHNYKYFQIFVKKTLNAAKFPNKNQFNTNKIFLTETKMYLTLCALACIFAWQMCFLYLQKKFYLKVTVARFRF